MLNSDKKITGIVLSGGKSNRMGKEKGFCTLHGKPLIEYSVEVLLEVCDNVIISANNNSYEYLGLPVVKDRVSDIGPISGLSSAIHFSETDDNFILSCDMPFISVEFVRYIISNKRGYQAVVPMNNGFPEPLCAYYKKDVARIFDKSIENDIYKIQRAFKDIDVNFINIDPKKGFFNRLLFSNINTEEELKRIEGLTKI
jgi:molybdopterin-guanine dinucleotide biosynthesis protein A